MKWLRNIAIGLALSLVLLLALYATLPNRYVRLLAVELVQTLAGGELTIGSLSLDRGARPRLVMRDVAWQGTAGLPFENGLTLGSIEAVVDITGLLRGHLMVESLSASNAQMFLTDNGSRVHADRRTFPDYLLLPDWLDIEAAELQQVELHYDKLSSDQQYVLSLETLDMPGGKAALPGSVFNAKGSVNDIPLKVVLAVDNDVPGINDATDTNDAATDSRHRLQLDMTAGALAASGTGTIDLAGGALVLDSTVSVHADSLADVGHLMQQDWPAIGPLDLQATVSGDLSRADTQGLDISGLQAELADPSLHIELRGAIDEIPASSVASLTLSASAPEVSVLSQVLGWALPTQWGSINAEAQLEGSSGDYSLSELTVSLKGATTAYAEGSLGSLFPLDDLQLDLNGTLASLAELSVYTPHDLPDIGPIAGSGVLAWQQGQWSLSQARASHNSTLGTAVVTGKIGNLGHFDQVRLRADADLPDFSALMLFIKAKLPAVDHVQASANLISTTAGDLSARQLRLTARRDEVSIKGDGSIDSIIKTGGVLDLGLSTSVDSLQSLESLLNRSVPDIGPLEASARLSGHGRDIALNDISVTSRDDSLSGSLRGDIGVLSDPLNGSFRMDLASTSLLDTAVKLGLSGSTVEKSATLTGQLLVSDDTLRLPEVQLAVDDSVIVGNITLQHVRDEQARLLVTGELDIDQLNLVELYAEQQGIEAESQDAVAVGSARIDDTTQGKSGTGDADRIFTHEKLPLDVIGIVDMDIKVTIRSLTSMLLQVSDAGFTAKADKGVLDISSFTGTINAGDAAFDMTIDNTTLPPSVTMEVSLDGVDLGRAGLFANSNLIENTGGSSLTLSLTGQGESVADILANANGKGAVYIEDLLFRKGALAWLSSDLLEQIARSLYSSSLIPDKTRFECTAMAFQIDKGVLETPFGLGIVSEDFSIIGNATIDLATEQLTLNYSTKPKGGLGVGLNTVANVTSLEGPLKSPSLSISQSGLLRFGATVGAAIASSGLSLLAEGIYAKYQANADVCAQAMGK